MCKQKSEWYDEFVNEIIMIECNECGHIEDTDEDMDECPECESSDIHVETSTAGMNCGICDKLLPDREGRRSYTGRYGFENAHQFICIKCYKTLVENEENEEFEKEALEEEMNQVEEDSKIIDKIHSRKLLKTYDEMQNVYDEETHYFVSRFYPQHQASAHNDRWIEPARWATVKVSKYEYDNADSYEYKQNRSHAKKVRIHVPYDEFVKRWEEKALQDLRIAEANPNIQNVTEALFGLKQYFYILKVRINGLLGNDIDSRIKKQTTEATINIILEKVDQLEVKQVELLKQFGEKVKQKESRDKEIAEKKRLEEIAELEAKLRKLKGE